MGEAMAQFDEALRLKPDDPEAHLDLGVVLAGQGKIREAIAQYSAALRSKPDYPRAHLNLGAALARQGKTRRGHRPVLRGPAQQP